MNTDSDVHVYRGKAHSITSVDNGSCITHIILSGQAPVTLWEARMVMKHKVTKFTSMFELAVT